MRQTHVAGHKAFVDYSGKKMPIADPLTGEVREAEIFVARAGRVQPHLRRGDLDAEPAGLDWRTRAHVPLLGRDASSAGARTISRAGCTSPRSTIPR